MKRRKIMVIFLIILVTILCVMLGIRTRFQKRILLTQLAGQGDGYIIETSEKNVIIIDGGTPQDAENLKKILKEKGNPKILAWFLTSIENEKSGALCELLKTNSDLKIEAIFASFNREVYQDCGLNQEELDTIEKNLEILYSDENRDKMQEMQRRSQYQLDNYFVTPLEIKEEGNFGTREISNQNVILKVDNTFKSVIFLGSIGEEKEHYFLENNKDQLKCDVLQISKQTGREVFEKMKPNQVLLSDATIPSFVKAKEIFTKADGNVTLEIW